MSKSDDNTNELESYGVWVKNPSGEDAAPKTEAADTSDELNLDDGGLDLPDFDDSDFSDMFKEEPEADASTGLDDFGSEDDTTLSTDELANITDGFEVEQVDAPAENESEDGDSGDLGDLGAFEITESIEDPTAEEGSEDISFDIDEPIEDTTESEEINFDEEISFDSDDSGTEEAAATEESSGDEEISLDDFMDGGFSDESVASGNNGYEPGAEPDIPVSSDTEELSLDDFMDGESFDTGSESKEEAVIEDEAPLDMDISFDDSADTVETEDNVSLEFSDDDSDEEADSTDNLETEEVSMDNFGSSFSAEDSSAPFVPDASSEKINTEEVDLSDFGVDADAEETPIVQDVEESKNKEKIVDYDLAVGNENTATAPVVNEIKSDDVEEIEEVAPIAEAESVEAAPVDNSLLQQIVSELSSLKDEMNQLKTNLEEIKSQDHTGAAIAAGVAGVAAGAAAASLADDDIDPDKAEEDKGGFFSEDDGDDTIALSFDELDNIMNTAEFSDTVEASDENSIEEIDTTNTEIEEVADNPDDTVIEESVITSDVDTNEASDSVDSEIENAISDEKDTSLDEIEFEENQSENFDFSDEKLEEPKIDEFIPDGSDEFYENEDLPDEIAIPKEDDLLVESNSSDFMDSVKETSEQDETSAEFIAEEATELDTTDLPSELPDDIPTVDKVLSEEVEEPAAAPENSSASFAEVDNLDNNLSESNLAYLDKQADDSASESIANTELKQDIKSVLLYMDQLLENLPEDKIVEFAKSDEFVTYKKLFNELGLS